METGEREEHILPRRIGALVVAALFAVSITANAQRVGGDSVRIVFFDVGQGDAALIITPRGKHILVDAGPSEAHIVSRLDAFGVDTLDLIVASHNHADHIGGMAEVLQNEKVLAYMDNEVVALTKAYRRTVDALRNHKDISVLVARAREFSAGGVALRVLEPSHLTESQNDNSIGLWLQFGAFHAVFAGDAEQAEITEWLKDYDIESATVVKAAHHGSANGSTPAWVKALSPKIVVVSVGAKNQYGHPSAQVLADWARTGASVLRTDSLGSIMITAATDGGFRVVRLLPDSTAKLP